LSTPVTTSTPLPLRLQRDVEYIEISSDMVGYDRVYWYITKYGRL
jgi:hypothetical protein